MDSNLWRAITGHVLKRRDAEEDFQQRQQIKWIAQVLEVKIKMLIFTLHKTKN